MPPFGEVQIGSGKGKHLAVLGAVGGMVFAILSSLAVPRFRHSIAAFGAEPSFLLRLIFEYYKFAWLLPPPLVLITWYSWPRRRRDLAAFFIGIGSAIVMFLIAVGGMYVAVFQSAAAI
jgi:hypothetical protein